MSELEEEPPVPDVIIDHGCVPRPPRPHKLPGSTMVFRTTVTGTKLVFYPIPGHPFVENPDGNLNGRPYFVISDIDKIRTLKVSGNARGEYPYSVDTDECYYPAPQVVLKKDNDLLRYATLAERAPSGGPGVIVD